MKVSVEVKGRAADRFRAYAVEKLTRKPTVADHVERAKKGGAPFKREDRIEYEGEQIAFSGGVSGSSFSINAIRKTVTRIVLFSGPLHSESVVGSAIVNATGKIEVDLVEPS